MKNLGKMLLGMGALVLLLGLISKIINVPLLGSTPLSIISFANGCLLLAIGLLLAEDKK